MDFRGVECGAAPRGARLLGETRGRRGADVGGGKVHARHGRGAGADAMNLFDGCGCGGGCTHHEWCTVARCMHLGFFLLFFLLPLLFLELGHCTSRVGKIK